MEAGVCSTFFAFTFSLAFVEKSWHVSRTNLTCSTKSRRAQTEMGVVAGGRMLTRSASVSMSSVISCPCEFLAFGSYLLFESQALRGRLSPACRITF